MSVRLKPDGQKNFEPTKVFDLPPSISTWHDFDVSADGQKFLMLQNAPDLPGNMPAGCNIRVVLNWSEEFRDKQ